MVTEHSGLYHQGELQHENYMYWSVDNSNSNGVVRFFVCLPRWSNLLNIFYQECVPSISISMGDIIYIYICIYITVSWEIL